jgi:hypothetical protein
MPIRLAEISPDLVRVDDVRAPDRDDTYVYEHLLALYALQEQLPAITVLAEPSGLTVVRNHKVLRAAKELGRPLVRAVVHPRSDEAAVAALLARPDVTVLDWAAIDAAERAQPVSEAWQVYFFARPLTENEQAAFRATVLAPFKRDPFELVREAEFEGPSARFKVRGPLAAESWYADHLRTVRDFHNAHVPVVSENGLRMERLLG